MLTVTEHKSVEVTCPFVSNGDIFQDTISKPRYQGLSSPLPTGALFGKGPYIREKKQIFEKGQNSENSLFRG